MSVILTPERPTRQKGGKYPKGHKTRPEPVSSGNSGSPATPNQQRHLPDCYTECRVTAVALALRSKPYTAQTGECKKRTFESSFVLALREPRRGAGSPARAAGNDTRKPAKSESDSEKPLQKSLPLGNVPEREDSVPQVKPVAIPLAGE